MFVLHRVSLIVTVLRDYGYMALSLIFAELKETVGWAWAKACALLSAIPGLMGIGIWAHLAACASMDETSPGPAMDYGVPF